ncbi:MAG: hypothetical protein JW747_05870 [Candidatus Aminicenantes bacterium]|nr:hypothetical protein [Candidatus Aminicenantes bacterium]
MKKPGAPRPSPWRARLMIMLEDMRSIIRLTGMPTRRISRTGADEKRTFRIVTRIDDLVFNKLKNCAGI